MNAVGFLAAVTARLADAKISVNAVSAFYHDHLFVRWDDRDRAMRTVATFELLSTVGDGRRILVVDDEPFMIRFMERLLRCHAYQVDSAKNGEVALTKIKLSLPDLVISDLMMPRMDGFELLQTVRSDPALASVRFMMLLARPNDEPDTGSICRHKGAYDSAVYKPFRFPEFLGEIARVLELAPEPEGVIRDKEL